MAVGSSILATIRSLPPQWPQAFTSMLKTRLRRCAQVIARRFSSGLRWSLLAPVDASSVGGRLPRPEGVSCARNFAFGVQARFALRLLSRGCDDGRPSAAPNGVACE